MVEQEIIPLCKTSMGAFTVLSLRDYATDFRDFLDEQVALSDDVKVLHNVLYSWYVEKVINVGESRSALIKLNELAKRQCMTKLFKRNGTLKKRRLDPNSSQFISARMLCGDKIKPNSYHTKLTKKAMTIWNKKDRSEHFCIKDDSIRRQFESFEDVLNKGKTNFKVVQPEDFAYGFVIGKISMKEAYERFPTLKHHEENRFHSITKSLKEVKSGKPISTKDHRTLMAMVCFCVKNELPLTVKHPMSVTKSVPMFWYWIHDLVRR